MLLFGILVKYFKHKKIEITEFELIRKYFKDSIGDGEKKLGIFSL